MLQELEKPLLPKQKKSVIDAIQSLGLRVSPSAVAEEADVPILVAAQELNRLATETGAHLEVTGSGAVVYAFDPRFEQAYSLAGPRKFFQRCGSIVLNTSLIVLRALALAGIFLIRISFGLCLIASVVALVVVAVMAILAALNASGEDGGGGGGDSLVDLGDLGSAGGDIFASQWSLSYWCFDFLWDWIFFPRYLWSPGYYSGWNSYSYYGYDYDNYSPFGYSSVSAPKTAPITKDDPSKKPEGKPRTKFLDSCFALLFGSGDPNAEIERKRRNDIAAVIRLNQGVVVSEQLAPYIEGNKENEDWMLPILTRFNGLPDVTETGHIIYLFPDFISTAAVPSTPSMQSAPQDESSLNSPSQASNDADQLRALYAGHLTRQKVIKKSVAEKAVLERYLSEENWQLLPENGEYEAVYLFVGLAVALSLGLLYASGSIHFLHSLIPLFYLILGYTSMFLIFPMVRWTLNSSKNKAIDLRNDRRLEASARLSSPSADLQQKLEEAHCVAMSSLSEVDNSVVYTTSKDALEQQFEH